MIGSASTSLRLGGASRCVLRLLLAEFLYALARRPSCPYLFREECTYKNGNRLRLVYDAPG